ncbi:MAG: hypothetical protein BWY75_00932 [bacterium ADurb.Bin425]|nr:MAG: hypothetical protein BWY75_00932 [bacterium ADurb.Bin425]
MKLVDQIKLLQRRTPAYFAVSVFLQIAAAAAALATTAPTITPGTGVYSKVESSVTISGDPGDSLYFTTNGSNPTSSSTPYTTPISIGSSATIKAIAYASGVPSSVTTAYIDNEVNTLPVPRSGLKLWLKGDFGTVLSGSNITQWSDLSGSSPANNATQGTAANQALLVNPAINGLPSGAFNGSSRRYTLANQFTNLTSGFSLFVVMKPIATATKTFFATSNTGPADLVSLENVNTQVRANFYNGTTASSIITPTNTITLSKFWLVDVVHNGSASASLAVNGDVKVSGTVQNLANVARTQNIVGANNTQASFWNGELAELLVFDRAVTETERKNIQGYLFNRYQLDTATAATAPIFSVGTSTLTAPQEVAIAGPSNAEFKFTVDGSTPTAASPTYTQPIRINYTTTLKAIAIANGITSGVTTATYTLDSTRWPAPSSSDTRALEMNLQLPTVAIPQ